MDMTEIETHIRHGIDYYIEATGSRPSFVSMCLSAYNKLARSGLEHARVYPSLAFRPPEEMSFCGVNVKIDNGLAENSVVFS